MQLSCTACMWLLCATTIGSCQRVFWSSITPHNCGSIAISYARRPRHTRYGCCSPAGPQVTKWRCALFGVFLGVPNPSIRALANRKIAEEYDEDSTVVEGQLDAADKDQALVPQQNSASGPGLDREAAAGVSAEGTAPPQRSKDITGGSGPAHRGTAEPGPATVGSGGDSGPSPRAHSGGGGMARNDWASPGPSRLRASFRDFAPPGQGSVSERGPDGVAGGTGPRRRATAAAFANRYGAGQMEASGPTPGVLVASAGTGATDKVAAAPSNLRLSWRQRTAAWQESVVRFFRMQYQVGMLPTRMHLEVA